MNWDFELPVKIRFGRGRAAEAVELTRDMGEGMLICDRFLADSAALRLAELSQGRIRRIYSDVSPNPTVEEVDRCCAVIKSLGCRYIIAMGGGSVMDLAKAASVMAFGDVGAAEYHTGGKPLPENNIPVFAVPTTAGTGSEVTCVSVLTGAAGKAPLAHPRFYADTAIIDPELTISVPPGVTAATGLDVLSHALEGYWSRNHQPICDAAAMHAARLVFLNLPAAYQNPRDIDAREKMCEASLIAGIAFSLPKTTGSHACSFPLTGIYGMPHGEACAFTLDSFIRINADERLHTLARYCGFDSAETMADAVDDLKRSMGLKCTLAQAGVRPEQIRELAEKSMHPNMRNNPVQMDVDAVEKLYNALR